MVLVQEANYFEDTPNSESVGEMMLMPEFWWNFPQQKNFVSPCVKKLRQR